LKLLLSIVSHNQGDLVRKLINSFDEFLKCTNHQVTIVITENVGCNIYVQSSLFKTVNIKNLRQKGFGANHNAIFEKFESDLFFIINPDIYLTQEFDLDQFVDQILEANLDITSPKILNPLGFTEDYRRSDLNFTNLIRRKLLRRKNKKFDWLAGMFLVIKSDSYGALCGCDTNFFMYVEDCDLNMRARRIGMEIEDIDTFSVVHDARRASKKSVKHLKWHLTSLMRYWFLT
jgi:N-acetylglucosaminyl-diphospho-decaprenol L-rhamnosyltransferase